MTSSNLFTRAHSAGPCPFQQDAIISPRSFLSDPSYRSLINYRLFRDGTPPTQTEPNRITAQFPRNTIHRVAGVEPIWEDPAHTNGKRMQVGSRRLSFLRLGLIVEIFIVQSSKHLLLIVKTSFSQSRTVSRAQVSASGALLILTQNSKSFPDPPFPSPTPQHPAHGALAHAVVIRACGALSPRCCSMATTSVCRRSQVWTARGGGH